MDKVNEAWSSEQHSKPTAQVETHTVQNYVTVLLFYFVILLLWVIYYSCTITLNMLKGSVIYSKASRRPRFWELFTYKQHFISVYTHV